MTIENPPSNLSLLERYNQVRSQIQHEDNLVTQRLNWFLTSQSFLFTAYAIVFNGMPSVTDENLVRHSLLMKAIPLIAILAGGLIMIAIVGGIFVMRNLRSGFAQFREQARDLGLPPLQGSGYTLAMGSIAPILLPLVFVVVWAILITR